MIERRREARMAIAAGYDFRLWPDLETDLPKRVTVFGRCATGKENSSAIDLFWQFAQDRTQTLGCSEPKIRRLQFSLLQNTKLPSGIIRTCRDYGFDQRPGRFRTAAFHSEDVLTGFHDWLSLAAVAAI
jgi:hypothetical protein